MADPGRNRFAAAPAHQGRGAVTGTEAPLPPWLIALFPIFFVLFWLLITSLLGLFSGWFQLQQQFPRDDDTPVLEIGGQSGAMGGVNFSGILTLAACRSGLRVGLWRMFGPFQRPFQVPWDQIEAEPVTRFLMPMTRLHFGRPATRKLTIGVRSWERLKAAAQGVAAPSTTAATHRLARAFLIQWAAITTLAGSFFYLVPRLLGPDSQPPPQIPLVVCFGFPALFFGLATFIRFLFAAR